MYVGKWVPSFRSTRLAEVGYFPIVLTAILRMWAINNARALSATFFRRKVCSANRKKYMASLFVFRPTRQNERDSFSTPPGTEVHTPPATPLPDTVRPKVFRCIYFGFSGAGSFWLCLIDGFYGVFVHPASHVWTCLLTEKWLLGSRAHAMVGERWMEPPSIVGESQPCSCPPTQWLRPLSVFYVDTRVSSFLFSELTRTLVRLGRACLKRVLTSVSMNITSVKRASLCWTKPWQRARRTSTCSSANVLWPSIKECFYIYTGCSF